MKREQLISKIRSLGKEAKDWRGQVNNGVISAYQETDQGVRGARTFGEGRGREVSRYRGSLEAGSIGGRKGKKVVKTDKGRVVLLKESVLNFRMGKGIKNVPRDLQEGVSEQGSRRKGQPLKHAQGRKGGSRVGKKTGGGKSFYRRKTHWSGVGKQ